MHLCRVGQGGPEIPRDVHSDLNRFRERLTDDLDDISDDMLELHENSVAFDAPSKRQHLLDDVRAAHRRRLNRVEEFLPPRIGDLVSQYFDRHHDRRKYVVEVMGDPAGERPDAFHPLCPQKLRGQHLFLCHITGDHDDVRDLPVTASDNAFLRVDVADGSVFEQEAVLEPASDPRPEGFLKHLFYPCHIVRMDFLKSILPQKRFQGPQDALV